MPPNLFLIHWNQSEAEELAQPLREAGWHVELEAEDGARAGQSIKQNLPDAVAIYLTRLPSHGAHTAAYLRETKSTRDIPVIFVGGTPEKIEAAKAKVPDALYINDGELIEALGQFIKTE
jgi:CheY-like chemotaxis protein